MQYSTTDNTINYRILQKTIQSVRKKNEANYLLAEHHQTTAEHSNFSHSDLRDNCESGYDCSPA